MATTDQGGVWRTINGYHVFIKDGQTASEAIAEQKQKEKIKTKETENKPKDEIMDKPKDPVMQYESAYKLESPVNDFDAAQSYLSDDDMTQYLPEELKGKISSAEWVLDDDESGRVVIKATEELTPDETKALQDWIDGQNSDGLGEGFEQQEFATSYWNPETGEGPFTYREFEQEQERMYDELEPYEYADYLDRQAVDDAAEAYMNGNGYDLDDEDLRIEARDAVMEDPEEYLDWEDIAYAKDEYFKEHGGSNEDEWYAMSSMRRDQDDFTTTPIEKSVEENTFTPTSEDFQDMKDWGYSRYNDEPVESATPAASEKMTEAEWVDQNIEKLKSDYKNETGKEAFENGRATREFAEYNTNKYNTASRYEELKEKFNRGEIEPYSAEDYELRDLKYQKAIDDGILTQEEVDYLKTKEDWQMDKASRADVDNAKHYMEEAERNKKQEVWEKQPDGSYAANKDAMKADYEERHKNYDAKIKELAESRDKMTNGDWEASVMAYETDGADGTYKTMQDIMDDVEAYNKSKDVYMTLPQEERVKAYEEGKNWKDLVKEQEKEPNPYKDYITQKDERSGRKYNRGPSRPYNETEYSFAEENPDGSWTVVDPTKNAMGNFQQHIYGSEEEAIEKMKEIDGRIDADTKYAGRNYEGVSFNNYDRENVFESVVDHRNEKTSQSLSTDDIENDLKWFEDMETKHPSAEGLKGNKEYQALKEDYESATGKKWNTPDDFELTAKKIIKDNTNNHKIWLWPDKEGKYNPETDKWEFIGMEGIMGGHFYLLLFLF